MEKQDVNYWAFISYSHKDLLVAKALHSQLERYRLPSRLVGASGSEGPVPARLFPVFRDQDELAAAPDLGETIRTALAKSRSLIVICSPAAARSSWVNKEVAAFKALGRERRIFYYVIAGRPFTGDMAVDECLPPAARVRANPDGTLSDSAAEPMLIDVRADGRSGRSDAFLRLVAGITGVRFDDLKRRDHRRTIIRRAQASAASLVLSVAGAGTYVALADYGVELPGAAALRQTLDRHNTSWFRPVHSSAEILRSAARIRGALRDRLLGEWKAGMWTTESPHRRIGPKRGLAVWVSSQAMAALLRDPDLPQQDARSLLPGLESIFTPGVPVESGGVRYGWQMTGYDYPQAEPALWTVIALTHALSRQGLLQSAERSRFLQHLNYAQEVSEAFEEPDGGWNILAPQVRRDAHCTYSAALALLALLELRLADLPWRGNESRRDQMLVRTSAWILSQFDARAHPPGWRFDPVEPNTPVLDGLTLFIYATLLRSETEAGVQVPSRIIDAIDRYVSQLEDRPFEFPSTRANMLRAVYLLPLQPELVAQGTTAGMGFTWFPSAVDLTARWLTRLERGAGRSEHINASRRVLGHLTVDLEPAIMQSQSDETWIGSEGIYFLSRLPVR